MGAIMKGLKKRQERLEIRVTEKQKEFIYREAKQRGISVADYLLLCVQIEYNMNQEFGDDFVDIINL